MTPSSSLRASGVARWDQRSAGLSAAIVLLIVYVLVVLPPWLPLGWHHSDMDAYWLAGERIRAGELLYVTFAAGPDDAMNYRYAPWFAYLWAPLTLLPRPIVDFGWFAILLGSGLALLAPLRGVAGLALALLMLPPLFLGIGTGNVQTLMVAGLAFTLHTRAGPAVLALVASLKGLPLLFVVVYVSRREWGKAAIALGLTALLVAPMLLYDLSAYPGGAERSTLPVWTWPLVGLGLIASMRWHPELAAAGAVAALSPLQFLYNLTYLLVPLRTRQMPTLDIAEVGLGRIRLQAEIGVDVPHRQGGGYP